ncbi:hypothetical protein HZH68_007188 [Vespula germanica]|uniref:Uncharacterized protein n=1 Tax=Vespula germanica TaxID=30212 RepID=A0A834K776_VESGE|nr:hypothetical protein HZH68_007188 [Vespula germanica]
MEENKEEGKIENKNILTHGFDLRLQVPFGGITDSQHPPADASAEIDGKTEKKKEEEKEEEEERRKEDWWYYLGQKTAKGPLIETGRQF